MSKENKTSTSFNISHQLQRAIEKNILFFNAENYDEIDAAGADLLDKSTLYRLLIRRWHKEKTGEAVEEALTPAEKERETLFERLLFGEADAE